MNDEREMEFAPLPKSYVKEDFCSNCGQLHEAYSLRAENERLKNSVTIAKIALKFYAKRRDGSLARETISQIESGEKA